KFKRSQEVQSLDLLFIYKKNKPISSHIKESVDILAQPSGWSKHMNRCRPIGLRPHCILSLSLSLLLHTHTHTCTHTHPLSQLLCQPPRDSHYKPISYTQAQYLSALFTA